MNIRMKKLIEIIKIEVFIIFNMKKKDTLYIKYKIFIFFYTNIDWV